MIHHILMHDLRRTDGESFTMEDQEKKLKIAIHSNINKRASKMNILLTPEALLAMTELTFEQFKLFGADLEAFAKHGKRTTMNADDIKLLLRRNPKLFEKLQSYEA
jgi:centromere protein S